MHPFSGTVAIATLSSRVLVTRDTHPPCAGAVAALKVTTKGEALAFSLHTHVPRSPARLTAWLDGLVADDPLLIGYRLARTSRLLVAAGHDRHLVGSFSRDGQHEILDVAGGRPTPLSTTALLSGVLAVDEDALLASRPIAPDVAANLALINAVASWVIYVCRMSPGHAGSAVRHWVLRQLVDALVDGAAPTPLVAAMTCPIQ